MMGADLKVSPSNLHPAWTAGGGQLTKPYLAPSWRSPRWGLTVLGVAMIAVAMIAAARMVAIGAEPKLFLLVEAPLLAFAALFLIAGRATGP